MISLLRALRWLPSRLRWKASHMLLSDSNRRLCLSDALGYKFAVWANEDVGRSLVCYGIFEADDTAFIRKTLREDDICLDIGANFGYYSVLMGAGASRGRVISVEPSPLTAALLKQNLALNGIVNVEVLEGVVSDSSGIVQFHAAADSAYSGLRSTGRKKDMGPTEVQSYTLDGIIAAFELPRVDILKIDVEGAEGLVVSGGRNLFENRKRRPRLVLLELYDPNHYVYVTDSKAIQDQMERYGYRPCFVEGNVLKPWTDMHRNSRTNVLFLDPEYFDVPGK